MTYLKEDVLSREKNARALLDEIRKLNKQVAWLADKQQHEVYDDEPSRCPPGHMPPGDCKNGCKNCWIIASEKAVSDNGKNDKGE